MHWLIFTLLFALAQCSPSSQEDYRQEGRAITRALIEDLRGIETAEQLIHAEKKLKKKFDRLVDLMIEMRKSRCEFTEDGSTEESALLKEELRRIYSIERGRECIERAQQEALIRLSRQSCRKDC